MDKLKKSVCYVLFFLLFFINQSHAENSKLNADADGLFIHGYDPVAYHFLEIANKGLKKHQLDYRGVKILFSSEENKTAFVAEPEKYIPSYGGYCSYGIRSGRYSDSDPTAFEIVDDRLFLMFNKGTALIWLKDTDDNIEVADKVWPGMSQ